MNAFADAPFTGNALITLAVLIMLFFLAPALSLTGVTGIGSVVRIGLILFFIPTLLRLLVRNKPETHHPDLLPLEMLI